MRTRLFILLVATVLLGTACTEGGSETTTTEGTETTGPTSTEATTTQPATTTTVQVGSLQEPLPEVPAGTVCAYLSDFVAVPQTFSGDAGGALGDIDPTPATVVLSETSAAGEQAPDEDIDTFIGEAVSFFRVGQDPYQVALGLRDMEIPASPIHVVGFNSHYGYQPGTDASPIRDFELLDVASDLDGQIIGVVDSGIALPEENRQGQIPGWFYGPTGADDEQRFVRYDVDLDSEELSGDSPASHGTFISGLIRQIAPEKQVSFAAARLIDAAHVATQGESLPSGVPLSAEVQVAEAMTRLTNRHASDIETMRALNLSLGTYVCDPTGDNDVVTLTEISAAWLDFFPQSQIVAAAGNDPYRGPILQIRDGEYVPFYPAALFNDPQVAYYDRVLGVAAVHRGNSEIVEGTEIVWNDQKEPIPVETPPGRPWVDFATAGSDLVNLSGAVTEDADGNIVPVLVCWSGSSFATAVASALVAANAPVPDDYDQIPRLTFVETVGTAAAAAAQVTTTDGDSLALSAGCVHDATPEP